METLLSILVPLLLILGIIAVTVSYVGLTIYGIVLSFQKKWYIGLASLVVPLFATIVGTSKFVFKKDLLK